MKLVLIPFVEGETEQKFYDRLIAHLSRIGTNQFSEINKAYNVTGIGGFKRFMPVNLKDSFLTNPAYKDFSFVVVFFYDNDVFRKPTPPLDFKKLEKAIRRDNPTKKIRFIHVRAKEEIEDVYLSDLSSIGKLLNLEMPISFPNTCKTGEEKLKFLYHINGDFYIKGSLAEGLSESLDLDTVLHNNCDMFEGLCSLFGLFASCDACLANRTSKK